MKIKMLTLFFALGCIALSCKNDDDSPTQFESTAIISGLDLTLCACCGGWIINIDQEESARRFSELPQNATIDLENSTFPITVQLNWEASDEYCGNGIIIESIQLIE